MKLNERYLTMKALHNYEVTETAPNFLVFRENQENGLAIRHKVDVSRIDDIHIIFTNEAASKVNDIDIAQIQLGIDEYINLSPVEKALALQYVEIKLRLGHYQIEIKGE